MPQIKVEKEKAEEVENQAIALHGLLQGLDIILDVIQNTDGNSLQARNAASAQMGCILDASEKLVQSAGSVAWSSDPVTPSVTPRDARA